ncbi:MAG: hypothetical protein HYY90_00440 [Candidatus Omnitrophica bacterium]|nr:hypothetical protein [Candidatus Omnitrophota bacterium]MBI3082828.1 hypothetical protein [Candidatus Omnitrophota bacterium]
MKTWQIPLLCRCVLALSSVSCAVLQRSEPSGSGQTAPSGRVEKAGVSVSVQVIGADEAGDIFGVNLVQRGVQPLLLEIRNGSGRQYRFAKANVDERYIPAATAARKAYEHPLLVGGQVIKRIVGSVPDFMVRSGARHKPPPRPIFNRTIQESFVKEEIADAEIGPNGSLKGFLYVRPLEPGAHLSVKLIDVQTQEPLAFDLP